MSTPTELDPFQDALLRELRQVVAAGDVAPAATRAPRRRPTRRTLLAAAAVAALVGGALVLPTLGGEQPAYAVVRGANGRVDVRVERLEDAAGLERALGRVGVRADVTYLPPDTECAPGRYTDAVAPVADADFEFEAGDGYGYRLGLGPGAVGDTQTVVIASSRLTPPTQGPDEDGVRTLEGSWTSFGIAEGPVAPCRPVPGAR